MHEHKKRLLFLCAHRSIRELMAASLLEAQAPGAWNIWIASGTFAPRDVTLVRQVLEEIQVPLLLAPHMREPSFDSSWDEGVVICSGATNQ